MRRIGFLVNPIAGMGGRVGLKGTDGRETLEEAIRRGAKPVSPKRGFRFLKQVRRLDDQLRLMIAPGSMGEDVAKRLRFRYDVIGEIGKTTSSDDTVKVALLMKDRVDLLVFCGGDGTARNVLEGIGQDKPVLGVPAGVKVYSSVFAINPSAAADSAIMFLRDQVSTKPGEVVDVDEDAFRENRLSVKLFGYLSTLDSGSLIQVSKNTTQSPENEELDAIADDVASTLSPTTTYILGPGSTMERISRRVGVPKTLLGVDAIKGDGTLLGRDLDETALIEIVKRGQVKIIVSPIGGQGFLFGRGNQQISPEVLRRVGVDNIIVIATRHKIESLRPRHLLIDSGDDEIDKQFRGYARVVTGYREEMVVKVE